MIKSKWIAGAIGWAFGGPIGAAIGYLGAQYLDKKGVSNDLDISLLVLSSAVVQADGLVKDSEKAFVKDYFIKVFGFNKATSYLDVFNKLNNQKINNIPDICRQIKNNVNNAGLLEILHFLFGIAASDQEIHYLESDMIFKISQLLGINQYEFNSIKSMFVVNESGNQKYYDILGVSLDSDEAAIKSAYRDLVKKYHPDKLINVSPEIKNLAKEKFNSVNEAYNIIKKSKKF
tara:strand:- start:95 stop:790 length:696 start_codon:yes stop_codon:yes gene_type:complete